MPSCTSLLPLHCRNRPPHRSCSRYTVVRRLGSGSPRRQTATAPHSTTWPWVRPRLHRPPQLLVSSEPQEDRWKNRRRTQHYQQKEVLLFPYSCKPYDSAHTVIIPGKKLVECFLLHLLRDTKCTRFPPFTISPLLEVSSRPGFQFRVSRTAIKRSSTRLGAQST